MHVPVLPNRPMLPHSPAVWERVGMMLPVYLWLSESGLPDKADDVLCHLHGFGREGAGAVGAVGQDRIDMTGVGDQPLHLRRNRRQLCDAKLHQRILENGELPGAEILQHVSLADAGSRGIDPDRVSDSG